MWTHAACLSLRCPYYKIHTNGWTASAVIRNTLHSRVAARTTRVQHPRKISVQPVSNDLRKMRGSETKKIGSHTCSCEVVLRTRSPSPAVFFFYLFVFGLSDAMLRCRGQPAALRCLAGVLNPSVRWGWRQIGSSATAAAPKNAFGAAAGAYRSRQRQVHSPVRNDHLSQRHLFDFI